jgi:hypothetical protein
MRVDSFFHHPLPPLRKLEFEAPASPTSRVQITGPTDLLTVGELQQLFTLFHGLSGRSGSSLDIYRPTMKLDEAGPARRSRHALVSG